ncbi:Tpr-related protein family member, putative [Theileria annulata]|uniref:Tpr-related protein family member, putative n=1 Tax=Theileria annulata TaxID=5874 RepID=Q4UEW7_THEAN|nr:Tpr-related protein family member, putative [Theileria annulata]CAI74372.1 Tpr-related protein family member, putative [Theileria annulata]|eukprot:XP_952104.1 Tpr-related protein family member, putative [Theileria annulata]
MEQVYNHTQDKPSYHADVLKAKAPDIKDKAQAVSSTADSHSRTELTAIRETDIQGDSKKGSQLQNKANQLKRETTNLYTAADAIVTEAALPTSPLNPLRDDAEKLRDAAKKDPGDTTGLYGAAQLATHPTGTGGLDGKAKDVINKFELVASAYGALMASAKVIQKETDPKVTAVDTAYKDLKGIYDRMLNLTKLHKAANDLQQAASTLPALSGPAGTLAQAVKTLRDNAVPGNNYENAQTVIQNFEKVETAYSQLPEAETASVKDKFEALKTVYNSILNFAKIKYYSTQLATAAEQLSNSGVNPEEVITNFNAVATAYKQLGETEQKHVQSQFDDLQIEYSRAIYFYKWHFITLLPS